MTRLIAAALVLFAAHGVSASSAPAGETGDTAAEALALIGEVTLPGMTTRGGGGPKEGDLERSLIGLPVKSVRAIAPPAGFDPVADAEFPLGVVLDRAIVRRAIARLWATGSYKKVEVLAAREGDGVVLTIRVEPLLRVHKLSIEGNKEMDDDEVARALGYAPDLPIEANAATLLALRQDLLGAYAERGYREARAVLTVETTQEPGKVALVVEVVEGKVERYKDVSVAGLPDGVSESAILSAAKLRRGTPRDKARIDESRDLVAAAFAEFGYRDAVVGSYSERRLGDHEYALVIHVAPGLPSELVFSGFSHFRERDLQTIVDGKGTARTTAAALESARAKLVAHLVSRGFLRARVEAHRICVDGRGRESTAKEFAPCGAGAVRQKISFRGREGSLALTAGIAFQGNLSLTDAALEREVRAFVAEKTARSQIFQPIDTRTLDALGEASPAPDRIGRPRGALAASARPADIYVPEVYRAAAEHLTALYREKGFLSAKVVDTCEIGSRGSFRALGHAFHPFVVERAPAEGERAVDGEGPCVFLTREKDLILPMFSVSEGIETRIERISFRGNDPENLTERELLAIARLAPNEPYNEYRLREAARDLQTAYGRRGHVFADVSWSSRKSPDMSVADVDFTVREGPKAIVKRVVVRGNAATSARLIRDRIALEPGDTITPEALSTSERRLMELGIFDSATVRMLSPETAAAEKSLLIQVQESKQQYLELRGGIATIEGLRGGFEYGYRNLGGLAIAARLRARANYRLMFPGKSLEAFERRYDELSVIDRIERHLLAGVSTQHVPGTGGLLGLGIDVINERTNNPAFSADRASATFRVTSNRLRQLPVELRTGVEWTDLELATDASAFNASPLFQKWARLPEGESIFSVTGLTVSLDLRDDVFNPSRGLFATVNADLVRSLGSFGAKKFSNLIRAEASLSGYIPLVGTKMVLALSVSAGYVFHLEEASTTWADRYFYFGGVGTLRGFPEDSLVPEDFYRDWKKQVLDYDDAAEALLSQRGGESMFLARAEFRYPLAKGFYGAVFSEAGNIWRERTNIGKQFSVRPVTGLGLRYLTPIGPFSFDLGANLDKRPHEERFAWYLSIGSAF